MRLVVGRTTLLLAAMVSLAFALSACASSEPGGELWGVDYSKGVMLPPSDFPGPNNNPPPMKM
jgi:hypothetical protein